MIPGTSGVPFLVGGESGMLANGGGLGDAGMGGGTLNSGSGW